MPATLSVSIISWRWPLIAEPALPCVVCLLQLQDVMEREREMQYIKPTRGEEKQKPPKSEPFVVSSRHLIAPCADHRGELLAGSTSR